MSIFAIVSLRLSIDYIKCTIYIIYGLSIQTGRNLIDETGGHFDDVID